MSYLTLIDKLMLTYINKELYFIIHSKKKFKIELNFVKCIAKNKDWDNFLNLKFDEILNKLDKKCTVVRICIFTLTYVFLLFP